MSSISASPLRFDPDRGHRFAFLPDISWGTTIAQSWGPSRRDMISSVWIRVYGWIRSSMATIPHKPGDERSEIPASEFRLGTGPALRFRHNIQIISEIERSPKRSSDQRSLAARNCHKTRSWRRGMQAQGAVLGPADLRQGYGSRRGIVLRSLNPRRLSFDSLLANLFFQLPDTDAETRDARCGTTESVPRKEEAPEGAQSK